MKTDTTEFLPTMKSEYKYRFIVVYYVTFIVCLLCFCYNFPLLLTCVEDLKREFLS